MRENRTYGSEGGEPGNGSLPYPYRATLLARYGLRWGFSSKNHLTESASHILVSQ
jgi:hypothetical protein